MSIFPYEEFRQGQKEIYEAVLETLRQKKPLLISAPTGIGKTAAVMAAVVQYMLDTGTPVHYAVRTRSELEPPVRELNKISARGVHVDYAVIKGRQDMCCYTSLKKLSYLEFLAECSLLKSTRQCAYYPPREVEAALRDVATYVKHLCTSRSCPYEYAKNRLKNVKLIISTYYYVFGREKTGVEGRVVVVDEAHSLVDAVTKLHSVEISDVDIKSAYREARKYGYLEEAAKIYRLYAFVKKTKGPVDPGDLATVVAEIDVENAAREIAAKKIENRSTPYTPLLLIKELREVLRGKLRHFVEVREVDSTKVLTASPLDPVALIRSSLEGAHAVVFMSGTLSPRLFADVLALDSYNTVEIPFNVFIPRSNYKVIIDVGVTTRYEERGEETYLKIAKRIAALINYSPGGVLAVFPSYEVMRGVKKYLKISIPHWYEGVADIDFTELPDKFFIGAVARGRYTEGVEYVRDGNNLLTAVAVVGIPYPEPSPYLEKRVEYLKPRLKERAWNAVYLYEAVVAVRQALGRLFRSPRDRGVLAFLDWRYTEPEVWKALEDIFTGATVVKDLEDAVEEIERFFTSELKVSK